MSRLVPEGYGDPVAEVVPFPFKMPVQWGDDRTLFEAGMQAIRTGPIPVSGGWSSGRGGGSAYTGGVFEHRGDKWVACQGEQRPGYARLLDATVALKARQGARFALAILDPPTKPGRGLPTVGYHDRFQAAAWRGLDLAWLPTTTTLVSAAIEHDPATPFPSDLGEEIDQGILHAAKVEWAGVKKSRDGEKYVRPMLDQVLNGFGYVLMATI